MNSSPQEPTGSLDSLIGKLAGEFTDRINRGERPSIEDYVRRYPELANVLRPVLGSLAVVSWQPPQADATASRGERHVDLPGPSAAGVLGDFRILREIGHGGMGIVYEAEQLSLARHVALKVLPFTAMLSEQQLRRFKNEARAAATLEHPNIVPVYAVGCDRGVHYYAMSLIAGYSVADLITGLRESLPEGSPPSGVADSVRTDKSPAGECNSPAEGRALVVCPD